MTRRLVSMFSLEDVSDDELDAFAEAAAEAIHAALRGGPGEADAPQAAREEAEQRPDTYPSSLSVVRRRPSSR
jgi:hypothetical protein